MVKKEDVDRLIEAHKRISTILEPKPMNPISRAIRNFTTPPERKAAQVLCEELGWFVNGHDSYWRGLEEKSEELAVHKESELELMSSLRELIDKEVSIFKQLGISEEDSSAVIGPTYDAFTIVRDYQGDPSVEALRNLRDRLRLATDLMCRAGQGRLKRAYDKVIGNKGGRILAGGTVAGANVAVAVMGEGGVVSWVSLKAGYHVMRGDTEGLIDLLEGDISDSLG